MSYKVKTISVFERQAKKLKKKYPSLNADLKQLIQDLKVDPSQGTPLGRNCFKIRIAISSKNKGKSGGARVITNIAVYDEVVYLLTVYDKSKKTDITDQELEDLLSILPEKQ